jgi:hypothetical protein
MLLNLPLSPLPALSNAADAAAAQPKRPVPKQARRPQPHTPAKFAAKPSTPAKKPAGRSLLQNKNYVDRFTLSAISLNDAQARVANAASTLMSKANSRFAHVTRRSLLQNKNNVDRFTQSAIAMNDASSRVANAASDLAARANSRFSHATRHLLKEGDMNAAADKIARTQYDLNAENVAR